MPELYSNILEELFDVPAPWRRALFLTYTFDSGFFAEVIEPYLRGGGSPRTLILMDNHQNAVGKITLLGGAIGRYTLGRFPAGQLFHPKLYLLIGTEDYRCVITSANLTKAGLYRNRELFTIYNKDNCDVLRLIEFLESVSARLQKDSNSFNLVNEIITELKPYAKLSSPVSSSIEYGGLSDKTLLQRVHQALEGQPLKKAVILSPYFESPDNFDLSIVGSWLKAKTKVEVYVPLDTIFSTLPDIQLKILKNKYPKDLKLIGFKTDKGRALHAKLLVLIGTSRAIILSGSANFTSAALKGANVELCVLSITKKREIEVYLHALLKGAKEIGADSLPKQDIKNQKTISGITGFILSVVASIKKDRLIISLDRTIEELGSDIEKWIYEINGKNIEAGLNRISHTTLEIAPISSYLHSPEGYWDSGVLSISLPKRRGHDHWIIELDNDELVNDEGVLELEAQDLENFYSRLFSTYSRSGISRKKHILTEGKGQRISDTIEDIEAEMDKYHRIAIGIHRHFARLMKDPYTIHNWRRDFINLVDILENENKDPQYIGLISIKVLEVLKGCTDLYEGKQNKWIEDHPELLPPIKQLVENIKSVNTLSTIPFQVETGN